MDKRQYDVVALGELLIDFTQNGKSEQGNNLFEANPGGAPANVLAMLRKLGKKCAFIGKVGKDGFGDLLEKTLQEAGVDSIGLKRDAEIHTTLAIVQTLPGGDRDFSFYRNPGADIMLREDELDVEAIENCKIFHFGTLSLTDNPSADATRKAVELADKAGAILSFDPNLRMPLWRSAEAAKEAIEWGLERCDILKISDNEVEFMTGHQDFDKAAAYFMEKYPRMRLVNITAGADGSHAYYGGYKVFAPACSLGGIVDTTGAGDTFGACVLNFVLENGLDGLTEADLEDMLVFSNSAAYLVATKKGAIRSMPDRTKVQEIIAKSKGC